MHVRFDEAGEQRTPLKVQDLRSRPPLGHDLVARSHRADAPLADRDRLGVRDELVHGHDRAAENDDVGGIPAGKRGRQALRASGGPERTGRRKCRSSADEVPAGDDGTRH